MTIRDLLEQASLDALGLLDDEERAEFEAAFRSAPPEIQAQVRREQRRAAELDAILPEVDSPPGLRARVIAAVRKAIADVSTPAASLEPVATIGRGGLWSFTRATPVWRAACIGFATATVVLSGGFAWMRHENRQLAALQSSDQTIEAFQKTTAGARAMEILAARNRQGVSLVPAANDIAEGVVANLYLDVERGEAVLFCKGLPALDGAYKLVIDDGSSQRRVQDFKSTTGGLIPVVVKGLKSQDLKSLAIIGQDSAGGPERTILRATGA